MRVVTKVLEKTGEVKKGRRSDGVLRIQTDRIFDAFLMPENLVLRNQLCITAVCLGFQGEYHRHHDVVAAGATGLSWCAGTHLPAPFHDRLLGSLLKPRHRDSGKNFDL